MVETQQNLSNEQIVRAIEAEYPHLSPQHQLAVAMIAWQVEKESPGAPNSTSGGINPTQIRQSYMRLQSLLEQQSAVVEELDQLAAGSPCKFEPKQIWILIRAIKAQSRIVDLLLP